MSFHSLQSITNKVKCELGTSSSALQNATYPSDVRYSLDLLSQFFLCKQQLKSAFAVGGKYSGTLAVRKSILCYNGYNMCIVVLHSISGLLPPMYSY
jgi:hypothetical protein